MAHQASAEATHAWQIMRELVAKREADVKEGAHRLGLSPMQGYALMQIADAHGCLMSDLADRLGADPSHVTRLVDRLERAGFVTRREDHGDRRARVLELTDSGEEVVQSVLTGMDVPPPELVAIGGDKLEVLVSLLTEMRPS